MPRNSTFSMIAQSLAILMLLWFFGVASPTGAQAREMDQDIAAGYLRQAEAAYRSGEADAALALLERSLEFYPRFSEGLYLQGLILAREQATLHRARAALEQALASGLWVSTPPREAQTELARIYVRTRRYASAQSLLKSLTPDRGLGGLGSADLAELWARTLIGQGRSREAEELLERALKRYPDSPDLYILAGTLLAQRGKRAQAAELLDRALGEIPRSPRLLYLRAQVEADRGRRLEFLERSFAVGGRDPAAALLVLIDLAGRDVRGSQREVEAALERFLGFEGDRQVPLVDRARGFLLQRYAVESAAEQMAAEAGGGEEPRVSGRQDAGEATAPSGRADLYSRLLERLDAALAGYTGLRIVDADGDGLHEERYEYDQGRLAAWLLDRDQDGLPEARAQYEGESPRRLTFPASPEPQGSGQAESSVEYVYSRYPYLKELVYTSGGSRRVYELVPFLYAFDALQQAEAGSADHPLGRKLRLRNVVDEAEARLRATRMAETILSASTSTSVPADRVYTLLNGQTVRIDQDPDREGRYRHQVLFEGGRAVSGRRDLDGDGVFETREQYAAGALRMVVLDQDGDGNPEFTELFEPGAPGGSEKRWDYNSDGRFDSRQLQSPGGTVVREFSSGLDGLFDLRAVFRNGRLEEFRRGERLLSVRYDRSRDLYRIGPIRDLNGLPDPLAEGVYRRGGNELFVFEHQGKIYIGELE